MTTNSALPVQLSDIDAAARRLAGIARHTPLLSDDLTDEALGARLFVKAECLQRFGAFKIRGAYNAIATLDPQARARGVIAYSSGNHAIAVAAAARMFGVPAVIVMPADAPAAKRDKTRAFGGEVVLYDRVRENRDVIGARIGAERGLPLIKPFDDPFVIAGQGTVGLEILADLAASGHSPDVVLVCASGGGLAAGVAIAVKAAFPACEIYPVEPDGHDDIVRSLAVGARVANPPGIRSIADALLVDQPGEITFTIGRALWAGAIAVSDAEILHAMREAFNRYRIVVEPGGAVALAAVFSGKLDLAGKTVVAIASGGNVDAPMFARALALPD